jgi:hypothetical protein
VNSPLDRDLEWLAFADRLEVDPDAAALLLQVAGQPRGKCQAVGPPIADEDELASFGGALRHALQLVAAATASQTETNLAWAEI